MFAEQHDPTGTSFVQMHGIMVRVQSTLDIHGQNTVLVLI